MRPFRFGVVAESVRTPAELFLTARRAEDAGFSTLLIRDHFIEPPFGHQLAPLPALTAVAGCTSALRVGTFVLCNDYRHPVLLAKEAATIDVLSGGRFELGLGAGFLREEYRQAGLRFDEPRERVDRFEEALPVLKGLLGRAPFTHRGHSYAIDGLDTFPKPVQQPRPPILVGAAGRRMLAIAAREADIVTIQAVSTTSGTVNDTPEARSAATVAGQVERIRAAAGDRIGAIELSTTATVRLSDDPHSAAAELARERGWQVAPEDVLDMPSIFIGTTDQVAELMHERRARYGLSYLVVSDTLLDTVRPIVSQVAGR
jgi:probable F420-dependent oxidoreductase